MKYLHVLIFSLVFVQFNSLADEFPYFTDEELAMKYTSELGKVDLFLGIVNKINETCKLQLAMKPTDEAKFYYLVRSKTGYRADDFMRFFRDESEYIRLVEQSEKVMLEELGGCDKNKLKVWLDTVVTMYIKQSINVFESLDNLFSLPPKVYSEEIALTAFKHKVANYQVLPLNEVRDLAVGLTLNHYRYALWSNVSFSQKSQIDIDKALELRQYIFENSEDPQDIYAWAETQSKTNMTKAVKLYEKAAYAGHEKAEVWLGQYYLCINKLEKGMVWLSKAKVHSPDVVEDIIGENQELGKPVYCTLI